MANDRMREYVIGTASAILSQVYLTVNIYSEIKSASNVIKDEKQFQKIETREYIDSMKNKLELVMKLIGSGDVEGAKTYLSKIDREYSLTFT